MTDYRLVSRHVRYWRGKIQRWSNVYPLTGSLPAGSYGTAIANLKTMELAINYQFSGTVSGGLYEIALYDQSSGGVPVAVATYFPWATPGSWIGYSSTAWSGTTSAVNTQAEAALQVEWPAGLSKSGKPVTFKKWYHAVPANAVTAGTPDINATTVSQLVSAITSGMASIGGLGAVLGNSSRLAASTPVVRNYFGNHQMPRGRRRKALVSASGKVSFPANLLQVPGSDGTLEN